MRRFKSLLLVLPMALMLSTCAAPAYAFSDEDAETPVETPETPALSAPMRFCNFSPNRDCKKVAGRGVQPLNNYTCRFRPSSLKCTDKSGLDGLQADKWAGN